MTNQPELPPPRQPDPTVQQPIWTDETVARFWDYWATRSVQDEAYFSFAVGEGLINLARWQGCLRGEVLDYGCAKGHLTEKLLAEAVGVTAVDFSPASIAALNARFAGRPNWRGGTALSSLPSSLPAESFDLIYCVEVIEHLLPDWEQPTYQELCRLVRPGGTVIVTTPLAENLDASVVFCPFCDSTFHQMQHVRAFTAEALRTLLVDVGFEVSFCRGIHLQNFQQLLRLPAMRTWSYDVLKRVCGYRLLGWLDWLFPVQSGSNRRFRRSVVQPGDHLVAIATKPPAAPDGLRQTGHKLTQGT